MIENKFIFVINKRKSLDFFKAFLEGRNFFG